MLSRILELVKESTQRRKPFVLVRVLGDGTHLYSILAWEGGFEFVFRNGHERWSTVSPSYARRILEDNAEGKFGKKNPRSAKDFITLTMYVSGEPGTGWKKSSYVYYSSKEEALAKERGILDIAWKKLEGEKDASSEQSR